VHWHDDRTAWYWYLDKMTQLSIRMASTADYHRFLRASIISVRLHNPFIPIAVYTDQIDTWTKRISNVRMHRTMIDAPMVGHSQYAPVYRSRLLKINSFRSGAGDDYILYLDADTIALSNIEDIIQEFKRKQNMDCDLLLAESRDGQNIQDILAKDSIGGTLTSDQFASTLSETFGVDLGDIDLSSIPAWNSGVVLMRANAPDLLRRVWRRSYEAMIRSSNAGQFRGTDEISLALALHHLRGDLKAGQLGTAWNSRPTQSESRGIASKDAFRQFDLGARILHLAESKGTRHAEALISGMLQRESAILAPAKKLGVAASRPREGWYPASTQTSPERRT
jgi:hypothetical protein